MHVGRDGTRCELWSRKRRQFQFDYDDAGDMLADAEKDADPLRRERMTARAEFERESAFALLSLARQKVDEFCG